MNGASSVDTIEERAAGATDRRPVRSTDAKSGAEFELLTVDGRPFFLKVLDAESGVVRTRALSMSLIGTTGLHDERKLRTVQRGSVNDGPAGEPATRSQR